MPTNFYDKVAQKFGQYHTDSQYITKYPGDDPDVVFRSRLKVLSGKRKNALDLGCADGRFTLEIAPHFKHLNALDTSPGMLASAHKLQKETGIHNVDFLKQDANQTGFPPEQFDVVLSRRGPTPYQEVYRLLKPGGAFLIIEIGEKDTLALKKVFGRGQNYGQWHVSVAQTETTKAKQAGFKASFVEEYAYREFYASYDDLDLFLQSVPIFEDFDSVTDRPLLQKYAQKFTSKQGIQLNRHRVVFELSKPR